MTAAVGSSQLEGVELDSEPDLFATDGSRNQNWTFTDSLNVTAGYQTTLSPYLTAPRLIVMAESGRTWDPGVPALMTQMPGQISTFTAHVYGTTACGNTPTIAQLMQDLFTARFVSRFGALVQTLSPVPVRLGEVNSVACGGFAGVSDTLAAALWVVENGLRSQDGGSSRLQPPLKRHGSRRLSL